MAAFTARRSFVSEPFPDNSERFEAGREAAPGRMLVPLASGSLVGLLLGVAASRVLWVIVFQAKARDLFVLAAVAFTLLLFRLAFGDGPGAPRLVYRSG